MKYTIKYMLTKQERKSHQKKRILTQYGTIVLFFVSDPVHDTGAATRLRTILRTLSPVGWSLSGYHVSVGEKA